MQFLIGIISDPNDQQGSTKRVCLLLFVIALIVWITSIVFSTKKLPDVPTGLLNLIYCFLVTFVGAVSLDKGIGAYKFVKGVENVSKSN